MRKVDGNEALAIMRNGGECKASVLTYFMRDNDLFYRDPKGIEHRSNCGIDKVREDREWTVAKEPRCVHGNEGQCDICIAEDL